MKSDDRQLKKNDKKWKSQFVISLFVAIFSLLLLAAVDGKAANPLADYPSRPIEYVVHSSPGGNNDIYARTVSDIFQKEKILSQPLMVLNKAGGNGSVAMGYVFGKKNEPHIILNVSLTTFIGVTLIEKLPYTIKSFTPIVNLASDGCVMVVRSDSPFKTADDLIAEVRKRPKELIQGGSAFTAHTNMTSRVIQKAKGVQWNFISFKNEAEALINVLSGNVHFAFVGPDIAVDHVRAGKLRVLLTGAWNRYPQFKDIPTTKEAGMGEAVMIYRGIVGTPNMPDYAVKKLEAAFKKLMNSERFKKFMEDGMMQPAWMSTGEYTKLLEKEQDHVKALLTELNLLKK
jgi:putative tricarboxylic transport membrane protein